VLVALNATRTPRARYLSFVVCARKHPSVHASTHALVHERSTIHISTDCQVCFQTRSPWQLASTLGFVLDRESGRFLGLRPSELSALHEILAWGRVAGNNNVLRFFGAQFEEFSDACRAVFAQFKHLLPHGNNRVKVRVTGKDKVKSKEASLGSTLGEGESTGMVVVDYDGHPIRYNQLTVYEDIVARHKSVRFDVQAVSGDGLKWKRANSSLEIDEQTLDDHRDRISSGAQALRQDAFVKVRFCLCVLACV
jgi:hypothetical protein